jgi:hypothetical protein
LALVAGKAAQDATDVVFSQDEHCGRFLDFKI